ncbi:MAG: putative Mg(2+) transporter [Gammaproteobacteria bacterium]|nr:putative Mg(2+) transporter [Gammaproteobacteria bacterium]
MTMNSAFDEITQLTPDMHQLVRVTLRLLAALVIGTAIGLQRELTHKPAGLRTHMLVALGTALFVVSAAESGMHVDSVSRIVQGLATGIGFLGGGAILKLTDEREIHGLTTAAGIWMTAAASAAAGLGQIAVALMGTLFGLLVLIVFRKIEKDLGHRARKDAEVHSRSDPNPKDLA